MGRLAIRRVVYSGDKYSFESPYLNDGIVIMEGVNGHGKSTFMNLIYYGLGGRVQAFNKNDDNDSKKHNEIFYDTNNYVEIIYVFLTIFLYLLKCPQSLILSALRAFCFCGKPHISRSIFLYFRYQAWLKSW